VSKNIQLASAELKDRILQSTLAHCNNVLVDDATLIVVAVQ